MGFIVGGDKCMWSRTVGCIFAAGHYINKDPAIILYPARPIGAKKPTPVAIPLANAFMYIQPGHLVRKAMEFAPLLGFDKTDKYAIRDICKAIEDSLEDMLLMPPEPKSGYEQTVAELMVTIDGRTFEREIKAGDDNIQ